MDSSKSINIIELINLIKKRPGMYVGDKNQLDKLSFLISGFFMNDIFNKRISDKMDILFREEFSSWVRDWFTSKENFNFESDTRNYVYYIKIACEEEKQLDKFFELFDLFFTQIKD